jgi:hypothetical protein
MGRRDSWRRRWMGFRLDGGALVGVGLGIGVATGLLVVCQAKGRGSRVAAGLLVVFQAMGRGSRLCRAALFWP